MDKKLDSGMLQYTPKGAYYEGKDEQFASVTEMWNGLFDYDRALFALTSILNGTGFSKGAMTHKLLSNPIQPQNGKELVEAGLDLDFEKRVIMYNLDKLAKSQMARAIKNLLMLTGAENHSRVNNSRTRKVILEFVFNRDNRELDALAVTFKSKLGKLVRHALGKQDLYKILHGHKSLFEKKIGRYNRHAYPVVCYLFNHCYVEVQAGIRAHFPKIDNCLMAKSHATRGNIKEFEKLISRLPWRFAMGLRNSYKLNIPKEAILGKAKMSDKEELQMEAAVKRSGAKTRKVNYKAQDIYDLWKAFYFKMANNDMDNIDTIAETIDEKAKGLATIDLGDCAVVLDASHSMFGSDERPMHPFLTSLCIIATIQNVNNVYLVGGRWELKNNDPNFKVVFPANASPIWRGLVDAIVAGNKTIVVISDGYENSVKGMFEHVYKHFKDAGYDFNIIHINPVFSAGSKAGTTKQLAEGVTPMPVGNYKYLETEFIFNQMIENTEAVKRLLIHKYKQLIGGK